MTVNSTTSRVSYAGNGTTTTFSVPFYFLANADLVVIRTSSTGTQTTLVLNTDYTVTGAGVPAGGSITCTTAPGATDSLVIYRDPATTQLTDYQANDPFPAETHERALDKLTMLVQRLKDLVSRSIRLSDGDTTTASTLLPSPSANKLLAWNGAGTALINRDGSELLTAATYANWRTDVFNGTGAQTAFVLTQDPGNANNCDVTISGVTQTAGVSFTVSGATITFAIAPPAGTGNVVVRYGMALPAGVTDSNLVTFLQSGTNAQSRSVQSKLRDLYSVKDFGAVGDNLTDDTVAIQRAISAAMLTGGTVYFPRGRYYITAPLVLDYSTNTVDPVNGGLTRVTLAGDGAGASQIRSQHAGACINYRGGVANTDGVHAFFYVRDIGLFNGFRNAGSVGIRLDNCAFWEFSNLDVFGFQYGLLLFDTLSGVVNGMRLWACTYGFYSEFLDFSRPNAITFNNVAIASCRIYAGLIVGPSTFRICGGSIEGNGLDLPSGTPDGDASRVNYWGIKVVDAGVEGLTGLVMHGVYVEGNRGYADVWVHQDSYIAAHAIEGCSFARIYASDYTNYNILWSGSRIGNRISLLGNGFGALGTYTENASRPYVASVNRAVFVDLGGNVYKTSSSLDRSVFAPVRYPVVTKAVIASDPELVATGTNTAAVLYVTDGAVGSNPSLAVSDGTVWRYMGLPLNGTSTQTIGTMLASTRVQLSVTLTGAQVGDFVDVSASINLQGVRLFGFVSANNTVQLCWENYTGGSVTLGSATYYISCTRPGT